MTKLDETIERQLSMQTAFRSTMMVNNRNAPPLDDEASNVSRYLVSLIVKWYEVETAYNNDPDNQGVRDMRTVIVREMDRVAEYFIGKGIA